MISSWHRSIWKSIRHEYHRSDGLSYATGILRTVHISPFSSFSFLCYCKWQIWILTTGNGFTRRGYALRSAGKTKELDLITLILGFDIILFVLPWGSSSSRLQPGVVSDLTPRKTSIALLTLVFHRFRCRALQWDVTNGVLASAFRHVGLMDSLYCRLCFFIAIASFLTTWYDSYGIFEHHTRARSNAACKNQLLGTLVLPFNNRMYFFQPFRAVYR